MADNPWDKITRTQRAAVGLFGDAVSRLVEMGKTGVTRPEEMVHEMAAMAAALGELAGSTARPLEAFLRSQRQLAEAMAAVAVLQRQLAEVLETAAANHAAMVEALEMMTSPVVGVASRLRREDAGDAAQD